MSTLLAVVAAVVAGAFAGLVADATADKKHPARKYIPMLVIGVLAFAIIQTVAQKNDGDSQAKPTNSAPSQNPTPSVDQTQQAPQTTPPPAASTPSPTSTSPQPPVIQATSLLKLPAVNEDTNDDIDLREEGTIDVDGATYGRALLYRCSLYCNGSSPQIREVTLGRRFQRFTTTAAVLDTSTGRHRIDITLDSQAPKTFTVSPGHSRKIALNVSGISRMRIELYAPGELKSPIQAGADSTVGRNGGGLPGVGLGDPMLLPRAT